MEWLFGLGLVLAVIKVMIQRRHAANRRLDRRARLTGHRPDTLRMRLPR